MKETEGDRQREGEGGSRSDCVRDGEREDVDKPLRVTERRGERDSEGERDRERERASERERDSAREDSCWRALSVGQARQMGTGFLPGSLPRRWGP